jgi:CrcB protein
MTQTLAIAVGGALGALGRYWVSNGIHALLGRGFPYGTLVVNLLGSLAMGWLYVLLVERLNVTPEVRGAIMVGFLGAFTTFSTFSLETLALLEQGDHWKAGLNIVLSVAACIAAAWAGIVLGRTL